MVFFVCDNCNDTIKKPKIKSHRCYNTMYTCIDCNKRFDFHSVNNHTTCTTEEDKYYGKFASSAKKPKNQNGNQNQKKKSNGGKQDKSEVSIDSKRVKKSSKKRDREDDDVDLPPAKKVKSEDVVDVDPNVDVSELPWRRSMKKVLREEKSMDVEGLKEKVIALMFEEVKDKFSAEFDKKIQSSKFVVKNGKVTLKKKK
eukprot:TRINITY_DN4188_c0_g1_i1.p1 TRINITY_DN4188_c0_g1~~TRINITY_DN4188_c0_g1_i1.p1  ORF type:complete len:199 (+),score=55.05 TRINITY_DN4188_c0_g1_i1:419-1015(+)